MFDGRGLIPCDDVVVVGSEVLMDVTVGWRSWRFRVPRPVVAKI